jgi:CBS domain-containing protein
MAHSIIYYLVFGKICKMAITVKDLREIRQELSLITVKYDELVKDALSKMLENDFSQLPVVDNSGVLIGIISLDSILNAIQNFGASFDEIRVSHATDKCK